MRKIKMYTEITFKPTVNYKTNIQQKLYYQNAFSGVLFSCRQILRPLLFDNTTQMEYYFIF